MTPSTVEVTLESMAFGGDAVGRLPSGKVLFVRGGAPGERVRARVVAEKKSHGRAVVEEVLTAAAERVTPACSMVDRCGGCPWMHLSLETQRGWKARLLRRELVRSGAIEDASVVADVVAGEGLGFRTRCRLHLAERELGTRPARGRGVVPLVQCPILAPPLEAFALELAEALRRPGAPKGEGDVELYVDVDGRRGLWLDDVSPRDARRWTAIASEVGVSAIAGRWRGRSWWRGEPLRELSVDRELRFGPGVFVQTNREVAAMLVGEAMGLFGEVGEVAEVYAGAGTFTVHLASAGWRGTASEGDARAARWLEKNLEAAGAEGLEPLQERDTDAARRLAGALPVDLLVADPPRAGARALEPVFSAAPPRRVVLVSCHPMAAVRDASTLVREQGYTVERVVPVDLFPQTDHLEVVVALAR